MTVEIIKKIVSDHFGIPLEKIEGKTKPREVVIPRQFAMALIKHYFPSRTLKKIGSDFNRDHTTVINAFNIVSDLRAFYPRHREDWHCLCQKIELQMPQKSEAA